MRKRIAVSFLIGFVIIVAIIALNLWLFPILFKTSYLGWYLKNGVLIGFVTTITSLVWGDINRQSGLISSHPLDYLGSCLQVAGLPLIVLGAHTRKNKVPGASGSLFDILLMIPMLLILLLLIFGWLLVIVPLQYFVYLIAGAPARVFSKSDRRVTANIKSGQVDWKEVGPSDEVPTGWWDASVSSKPVAVTNLFVAMLLFGLRLALG